MWWENLLARRGHRRQKSPPGRLRLGLEQLEDRTVPSTYTAATTSQLIAAINASNQTSEADTITLTVGKTFTLTAVNNTTNGPTGLPTIAANENLTVLGNGDTIARSTAAGSPAFRLFDVAAGGSLRLENLTLQGGASVGPGGAVFSQGALTLKNATVQFNTALGAAYPAVAQGGGIYSAGALTIENGTIRNNQAIGAQGTRGPGGSASGGGVYVGGGTAVLTGVTLSSNTAQGGDGGSGGGGSHAGGGGGPGGTGGDGFGGGLYAAGGSMTMRNCTLTANSALGGKGGPGGAGKPAGAKGKKGLGEGGGLYIDSAALVYLDAATVAKITLNTASKRDPDIHGSYVPAT